MLTLRSPTWAQILVGGGLAFGVGWGGGYQTARQTIRPTVIEVPGPAPAPQIIEVPQACPVPPARPLMRGGPSVPMDGGKRY